MADTKEEYLALLRARLESNTTYHAATKAAIIDTAMAMAEAVWDKAWAAGVVAGQTNMSNTLDRMYDLMDKPTNCRPPLYDSAADLAGERDLPVGPR